MTRNWMCHECGRIVSAPELSYVTPNLTCWHGDHVVWMTEMAPAPEPPPIGIGASDGMGVKDRPT